MAFIVVYDACVLYPAPLRDLLVRLASKGVVRARWSETILDAGFRKRLETIFDAWRDSAASVLRQGQIHGSVRRNVQPTDAAALLIAMVEGYGSLAKNAQDPKVIKAGIKNIVAWLKSLRRPGNRKHI